LIQGIDEAKARRALEEAVVTTFADMFFVDAMPGAGAGLPAAQETCASIDLLKPLSIQIQAFFSAPLKRRAIETLFVADGPPDSDKEDAVLEIVNVIAGHFLTNYFGQGVSFKIELPQFLDSGGEGDGEPLFTLGFDAEGSSFRVALRSVRYRY
jgi:hypothetical protein